MDNSYRRLLLVTFLFALISCAMGDDQSGGGNSPSAPPELAQLEAQYESAKKAVIGNLLARYKAGLSALEEHYTKFNNLEGALMVKAEYDAIFSNACNPPMDPPKSDVHDFTRLQKEFNDALQTALAPAQDRYKASLAAMQGKLTRAGNLAGALAVKKTADNFPVTGKWRTTSGKISFVVTFRSDGYWTRTGYDKGSPKDYAGTWFWKDLGQRVIGLEWVPEGWKNEGDVSPDGKSIDLHVNEYRQTIYRIP